MPSAFLTAADMLQPSSPAGTARATAARTFGRCPDEGPAARRFLREALDGHPAAFDAELLTCELVTNAVQHAADAGWGTVAGGRRGAPRRGGLLGEGRSG